MLRPSDCLFVIRTTHHSLRGLPIERDDLILGLSSVLVIEQDNRQGIERFNSLPCPISIWIYPIYLGGHYFPEHHARPMAIVPSVRISRHSDQYDIENQTFWFACRIEQSRWTLGAVCFRKGTPRDKGAIIEDGVSSSETNINPSGALP